MKANIKNLLAYIESLGWNVYCGDDGYVELTMISPFTISIPSGLK